MNFITPAFAQETAAAADTAAEQSSFLMSMLPLLLIFFVFYVMVIRPQNKRMQDHRQTINDLKKGDKVVTGGGVVAKVVKLQGDDEIVLEIANGVEITVLKHTIMMLRTPPAAAAK